MLRERAQYYYENDYNCAEAILLAANDEYDLKIEPEYLKLLSGFGGGMCSGLTCGALSASIAVLGHKYVTDRANVTEGHHERNQKLVQEFIEYLGSENCEELKKKYKTEEEGCLQTVLLAADVLEKAMTT